MNIPQRLPFNWKNPIGYSIAVVVQLHMVSLCLRYIDCVMILGFAALLFAFTFVKDIKGDLERFNRLAKIKKTQDRSMKPLCEIIGFQIELRR